MTLATPGDIDYAWSSVGQYKDTASPMHVCMITSAIANDGVMMEPKAHQERDELSQL